MSLPGPRAWSTTIVYTSGNEPGSAFLLTTVIPGLNTPYETEAGQLGNRSAEVMYSSYDQDCDSRDIEDFAGGDKRVGKQQEGGLASAAGIYSVSE